MTTERFVSPGDDFADLASFLRRRRIELISGLLCGLTAGIVLGIQPVPKKYSISLLVDVDSGPRMKLREAGLSELNSLTDTPLMTSPRIISIVDNYLNNHPIKGLSRKNVSISYFREPSTKEFMNS